MDDIHIKGLLPQDFNKVTSEALQAETAVRSMEAFSKELREFNNMSYLMLSNSPVDDIQSTMVNSILLKTYIELQK